MSGRFICYRLGVFFVVILAVVFVLNIFLTFGGQVPYLSSFISTRQRWERTNDTATTNPPVFSSPHEHQVPSVNRYEDELENSYLTPPVKDALSLLNLPLLKPGRSPFMQLTAHEGNPDFSNFLYHLPDTQEFVLLDLEGAPGCILRAFFVVMKTPNATLRLVLDEKVIFDGNPQRIFTSGMGGLVPEPFFQYPTGDPKRQAMDMVFPFCFNSSALMTINFGEGEKALQPFSDCIHDFKTCENRIYMDIGVEQKIELPLGWDQYDYSKSLETPDGKPWDKYLSYESTYRRLKRELPSSKSLDFSITIGGKACENVFNFHGNGVIRAIVLKVPKRFFDLLSWEMAWEDAKDPQVQVPLEGMYNSWRPDDPPLTGYQLGAFEKDGMVTAYNFYPMPFLEKAIGRICNHGNQSVTIHASIIHTLSKDPEYRPGTFGYYHVQRVLKDWGPCFNELLSLQNQTGHIVAMSWYLAKSKIEWMENDPVAYIDHGRTPKLWYSGLEDEIGGSNGFLYYQKHAGPFFGWTDDFKEYKTSAYRLGFSDHHHFMKNYRYGIQGHNRLPNTTRQLDYTFHWYALAWPSLSLTDEVDLGDDISLAAHGYECKPSTPFVVLTSGIQGQWYNYVAQGHDCPEDQKKLLTKRGTIVSSGGLVRFRARIGKDNNGIILRRLVDLFYTPQRARVYIDGEPVGIWTCSDHAPSYAPQRFADNTDFLVHPKFTHEKTSVWVSLRVERRSLKDRRVDYEHLKGFGWTAYHYWIYSVAQVK